MTTPELAEWGFKGVTLLIGLFCAVHYGRLAEHHAKRNNTAQTIFNLFWCGAGLYLFISA